LKHGKGTVPSIRDVQECLVKVGDKKANFVGSKDWLGSVEVSIIIDSLCDIPCRILHARSGELASLFDQIFLHFTKTVSPRLASEGWVKWISLDQFNQDSFYNLCLPQVH